MINGTAHTIYYKCKYVYVCQYRRHFNNSKCNMKFYTTECVTWHCNFKVELTLSEYFIPDDEYLNSKLVEIKQ
jgi:hypothetical protein